MSSQCGGCGQTPCINEQTCGHFECIAHCTGETVEAVRGRLGL